MQIRCVLLSLASAAGSAYELRMARIVRLADAGALPLWRRPITLLFLMAAAMPIAFATWSALLNNFVIEVADFDGGDIGLLHTVREIPGFLAVGVIAIIIFVREQVLGLVSLILLGVATAITAWFPTLGGILTITMLSSIGFHYYETVNQSLQLQWLPKDRAPQVLGWLVAAGSAATLCSYGLIVLLWEPLGLTYNIVYLLSGGADRCDRAVLSAGLSPVRGPEPANQTADPAQTLLAVLRAAVHVGRAASDICGICRVHDGRKIRLCCARGDGALPDQPSGQHDLRPVHGQGRGGVWRTQHAVL